MLEPSETPLPLGLTLDLSHSLSDILEEDGSTDSMVGDYLSADNDACSQYQNSYLPN